MENAKKSPAPATGYRRPQPRADVDLRLDANEGRSPSRDWLRTVGMDDPAWVSRYPDVSVLQERLAARHGLDPAQVLVTAGADEGIDRACRVALGPSRALLLPVPSFEMFPHYARSVGADLISIPWNGDWPRAEVLARLDESVGIVAVVSPNNPTGAVARREDLDAVAEARRRGTMLLLDAAYGDFADDDLSEHALRRGDVVVLRSFSKSLGLAGLRVGYAAGPAEWIARMRVAGGPYSVAGPSLAVAAAALEPAPLAASRRIWDRVRTEREQLRCTLTDLGVDCASSQANFVLARTEKAAWVDESLQSLGIAIRRWPEREDLRGALRIGCPADPGECTRLERALRTSLQPQALLLDMDGVLADEGPSFREAIRRTASGWGVEVSREDIRRQKEAGSCNNDWELTHRLLEAAGVSVGFEEVHERFEELYQGDGERDGLWKKETLLADAAFLRRLRHRLPLGIVTGRPRRDAQRFLERFSIAELFDVVVGMEDAPAKPDPTPVRLALESLGAACAWMVGDTPDDARAARAAGVLPLGVRPPDSADAVSAKTLRDAGCVRVLDSLFELEELLP